MSKASITQLEFKITADTSSAQKGLGKLAETLKNLNSAAQNIQSGGISEMLRDIGGALNTVDPKKASAIARALNAFKNASKVGESSIPKMIKDIGASLASVDADKLKDLANAATAIRDVTALRVQGNKVPANVSDTPQGGVAGLGVKTSEAVNDVVADMNDKLVINYALTQSFMGNLKQLGSTAASVAKQIGKVAFEFAKLPVLMGGRLAASVKNVTSSLGGLLHQFGRIAIIKGIRAIISTVTKSFQDGVKALYEYSNAMGTAFAGSMDSLATSANYLSNSLAAMASPIINALAPAIDYLISKIVTLMNWINQLFAALGGAATFTAAKKTATAFNNVGKAAGGSGGKAGKAAKELKRYILAFDEINALGSQNKSSGGGGGGGGGGIGGLGEVQFEELPIAKSIKDLADTIKGYIKNAQWEELGQFLGDKVNGMIENIPWGKAGELLGKGLDGIIRTTYSFMKTMDFTNLGSRIAEFFNNAIKNVNWNTLGRLVVRRFTRWFDLLIGAIKTLDFGALAKGIGDYLLGGYQEFTEWLQSVDWIETGQIIAQKFIDACTHYPTFEIAGAILKMLYNAVKAAVELLVGALGGLLAPVFEGIKNAFSGKGGNNFLSMLGGKVDFSVNVNATKFTDKIPSGQKYLSDFIAWLVDKKDNISSGKKFLNNFTAILTDKQDKIKSKFINDVTATVKWMSDKIADKVIKDCTAQVKSVVMKPGSSRPVIDVTARIADTKAHGGVFRGGSWSSIPQYAGGTLSAGSMFIAGERGPELVGHIGGRTEVLNASQLAATMFSATVAASHQLIPALGAINANMIDGANQLISATVSAAEAQKQDTETLTASMYQAMAEASDSQNELLREQNDLLRDILMKDNSVRITTSSLTSAFNRRNQRDGKTIVPVGT